VNLAENSGCCVQFTHSPAVPAAVAERHPFQIKTMTSDTAEKPIPSDYGNLLYRLLFNNCMDGIMKTAPDGSVLDANPAACKMFGRTREEIVEEGRDGLIDTADPRLSALVEQRRLTGRAHGELRGRRKDGTFFPLELSSVVFENPYGQPRTCMIVRDISERKAADGERDRLIHELQDALGRVKTLSGLLPICASCRKIRDKEGKWHSLEQYVHRHTGADFSHGICPECKRRLYPESDPDR
jgi:PAS domain S-box-containing protein